MADEDERPEPIIRDEHGDVVPPEDRGDIADFYAPPNDPGGRRQIMTAVLVVVAIALVVFLVLLVAR